MTNKTISINPALFSVGGVKTKRKKVKQIPKKTPLISPNVLKKKLLNRIKEHKERENKNNPNVHIDIDKHKIKENKNVDDEFADSLNYLQILAKDNKKKELERKTLKHRPIATTGGHSNNNLMVNMDLPESLQQMRPVHPHIQPNLNTFKKDDPPFGILKGGTKQTYREWNKTKKNNVITNPNHSLTIHGGNSNISNTQNKRVAQMTQREKRLDMLREKIRHEQLEKEKQKYEQLKRQNEISNPTNEIENHNHNNDNQNNDNQNNHNQNNHHVKTENSIQNVGKKIGTKHITKKTIKRKYTLGTSKAKRKVGVLVKDRKTRKIIIDAQKELKRKSMSDIKKYLRDHNMIKVGSTAPNDVLRKMYENAMLSGELINTNTEILLHNFEKNDKE